MLCTAATDIYTQCGFERMVCIDQISDFVLPHLPNKYIGKTGLPIQEMQWRIDALRKIYNGELSCEELISTETYLPSGVGSKFYRESPDKKIEELLGNTPKRILVWGSGDGVFESALQGIGHNVSVIPLDAIVGESCRKRGLNVLTKESMYSEEKENQYDAIILIDILHLINNPDGLLSDLHRPLKPNGLLIVRIPNLKNAQMLKRRLTVSRFKRPWTHEHIGATPFTPRKIKKLLRR